MSKSENLEKAHTEILGVEITFNKEVMRLRKLKNIEL